MKKETTAVEKEQVSVDIIEEKEPCIVGPYTDKFHATGSSIDFTAYMFRVKVEGDEDRIPIHDDDPDSYSCLIYLDPKAACDLSLRLNSAIQQYEKRYGSVMEKEQ